MSQQPLSAQLEQALRQELDPGERILWTGVPSPYAFARAHRGLTIFGIFLTAVSVFLIVASYVSAMSKQPAQSPPMSGLLVSLPFLFVGLGIASVPLWCRLKAAKTSYAVTPVRAIVIEGMMFSSGSSVTSYRAEDLEFLERLQRADGSGDLVFLWVDAGYALNRKRVFRPRGFIGIANVQDVEKLLRKTLLPEAPVA